MESNKIAVHAAQPKKEIHLNEFIPQLAQQTHRQFSKQIHG